MSIIKFNFEYIEIFQYKSVLKGLLLVLAFTVAKPAYTDELQTVVKDFGAAKGWTSIVPIDLNRDGVTDFLSYNATTGRAIFSITSATQLGEQTTIKDFDAAKEWTSIVPTNLNDDGVTDLLSYNATTGRAIFSTTSPLGEQTIVKDFGATKGWISVVPILLHFNDCSNRTDLLSYNAVTGRAVYSVASLPLPDCPPTGPK